MDEKMRAAPDVAGLVVPGMTSAIVNDCCWTFVEAMPHNLPGPIFNDLKPALYEALKQYHGSMLTAAPAAPAVQRGVPEETINAVISLVEDAAAAHLNSEFRSCLSKIRKLLYAAPQPAPDVTQLVEALELALEYWKDRQQRYKNRKPRWVADAESALAAYRKGD